LSGEQWDAQNQMLTQPDPFKKSAIKPFFMNLRSN